MLIINENIEYNGMRLMDKKRQFFAKSFEDDFVLKTLDGTKKMDFQSIDDIVRTSIIKLNTKSFGRKRRLACSFLHKNYLKTYRSQGLIFATKQKPDLVSPFDLVLLSDAEKLVVQYYRIKENLHVYYNHKLMPGFERFLFNNIDDLLKSFSTVDKVWLKINKFRVKNGYDSLPKSKHKLVEYNETIFYKPVKVKLVAIFGYTKLSRDIAKKYDLPHFVSVRKFYSSLEKLK